MPPQPTEVSQNTQSVEHPEDSAKSSQYGSRHGHPQASSHLLDGGDGSGTDSSVPPEYSANESVSTQPRTPQTFGVGWLNDDTPTSDIPLSDRISQYEKSRTPSPRNSPDLIIFKVTPGQVSGTTLTHLPNGT